MSFDQVRDGLYSILPIVATLAAVIIVCRIFKTATFIPGSTTDWLYLAIACAAAKMAR